MSDYKQIVLDCRHCANKTVHNIMGAYETESFNTLVEVLGASTRYEHKGILISLLECKTCKNPSLVEGQIEFSTSNNITAISLVPIYNDFNYYAPNEYILERTDIAKLLQKTTLRVRYPINANVTMPSKDMPDDVANDYREARSIFEASPRSSAALLRLAIQKLCKHLGQSGNNINADISALVKAGLPVEIQQALDIVRVVGNNAVHPGTININDDPSIAKSLFELVNIIVEVMISRPRRINEMYNNLPANIKQAIHNRDNKNTP